jgi:hypothetical protein
VDRRLIDLSFEVILVPYLALVRLSLLLPSKTVKITKIKDNDKIGLPDEPVVFLEGF